MSPTRLAVALGLLAAPALADRAPTVEERAAIEARLTDLGFVVWDEIELEERGGKDLYWEVEDARDAAGVKWDLRLSVGPLEEIERERD